jgi:hypothetical protein
MSLKYYMISPLIIPKIKKALSCKKLKRMNFFYNQKTGEQIIEVETENGISNTSTIISIKNLLNDGMGRKLMDHLNKTFPKWISIFCEINDDKKQITLIFLNESGEKIGTLNY